MPSSPTAEDRAGRGAKGGEADGEEKEREGRDGGVGGEDKGKGKYDGEWIVLDMLDQEG
jgi:hypothetical protein